MSGGAVRCRSGEPVTLPVGRDAPFDPPPALGQWRAEQPLRQLRYPDGHIGWLATSYQLVREILADPRFSSRSELTHVPVLRDGAVPFIGQPAQPGWLVDMDPPAHTRIRRVLGPRLSERQAGQMRRQVADIVAGCLDQMAAMGPPADLVQCFAVPVPALVIGDLLGVPESERATFCEHSTTLFSLTAKAEQAREAMTALNDMLAAVIAARRRRPGRDLLSALIGGDLTDAELTGAGVLLLTAGHDSISNMIGLGTYLLLSRPDQMQLIQAGRCSLENAVEEMLRYLTVFQFGVPRTALEDVIVLGQHISAGQCVTLSLPAANRDPSFFEDADELDLGRPTEGQLAFGHGIHKCIGRHLARLELRASYQALFERFGRLRLAVPATEIEMSIDSGRYGVRRLPVAW
jgi:cytochrome P450